MAVFYPTCSPNAGNHVDVGHGEGLIVRHRLQHVCSRQAVASALEKRGRGATLSRESRQIDCSLRGERTIVMAPHNGRIAEKSVKHDGILLSAGFHHDLIMWPTTESMCPGTFAWRGFAT